MKRTLQTTLGLLLALTLLAGCAPSAQPAETSLPTSTATQTPTPETLPPATTPVETPSAETPSPEMPLPEPEEDDLVRVADYIPDISQELAYATGNNFTGQVIYDFSDAYLRYGTVKLLAQAQELLKEQGLGLKIWDGFRPVSAQQALWDICPDPNYVSHPETGNRSHCRGSAVDVTLIDLSTGQELDMPTGFDSFTALADRDYSDCSETQRNNALLLESVMTQCGFKGYWAEWWHYTAPTDYPVDEYFDPAVVSRWSVTCEEYVNLRSTPSISGESIGQIPNGADVTLMAWTEKFAYVSWQGQKGFVMAGYLMPKDRLDESLTTVEPTDCYSYQQLETDIKELDSRFPGKITSEVIGKSENGLDIPVIRLGSDSASHHILLQGGIHGREHMTVWLVMALAENWLSNQRDVYSDVCIHIIPVTNPDGAAISQSGQLPSELMEVYQRDVEKGYTTDTVEEYARIWKANGLGVDINRNFDAGWEETPGRELSSSQRYKGEAPFSTPEAQALRDYTLRYDFDATLSYHASGSILYYEYGNDKTVNDQSASLAKAVGSVTGYSLVTSDSLDAAGYKDWAMDTLGIPSLTVEVGCQEAPLALRECYSMFVRNRDVLPRVIQWIGSVE